MNTNNREISRLIGSEGENISDYVSKFSNIIVTLLV